VVAHYRGRAGLSALEREWRALTSRLADPAFYHTYDWHWAHVDAAARDADFHFIVVRRDGVAVAICPLRRRKQWISGVRLTILDQPDLEYVHCDVICDPAQDCADALDRVVRYLRSEPSVRHNVLRLRRAREDAIVARALGRQTPWTSVRFTDWAGRIPCDRPYAAVLVGASRKRRRNLRVAYRRLECLPDVSFSWSRSPHEVESALSAFLDVEASGWKGSEEWATAVALDPEERAVFATLAERFAGHGACEIGLLRTGERCIAGLFGLISGGTLWLLKIGHDERYRHVSPGHLLVDRTLQRACADAEIHDMDFITCPSWIHAWRPERVRTFDLVVWNPRPLSLVARALFGLSGLIPRREPEVAQPPDG
jgi:CelD/BcsL family acetyltransferase involved in cellulose biosynthesis